MSEACLSPESLQQIKRLDLRARMVDPRLSARACTPVRSQGFSVQFSEHRRYNRGDDPKLIDWLAYAKTDKYFVKRFEAETNLTGYLGDGSLQSQWDSLKSQTMTKFEYCTCLGSISDLPDDDATGSGGVDLIRRENASVVAGPKSSRAFG